MNVDKMNEALSFLREKYGAKEGLISYHDGNGYVGDTILLPQRVERRFIELKKMTMDRNAGGTGNLEGISTLRFASFAPIGASLRDLLARELDIASFLGNADIVKVFGAGADGYAINVLAKLANDINVSVEIGAGMPAGSEPFDRHEIIARRGVASDQTVDTHTKHSSLRLWGEKGTVDYTDVDTELFGLDNEEVWIVRAAFALLQGRADGRVWTAAMKKAYFAADMAFLSDKEKTPKTVVLEKNAIVTTNPIAMAEVR